MHLPIYKMACFGCNDTFDSGWNGWKCNECEKAICRDCAWKCGEKRCKTHWCYIHVARTANRCSAITNTCQFEPNICNTVLCSIHATVCGSCDVVYCDTHVANDWDECSQCHKICCTACYNVCANCECVESACAKCIGRKSGDDRIWFCANCAFVQGNK